MDIKIMGITPEILDISLWERSGPWEKFRDNILDMGGRLGGGKVVTSQGESDGPFVELKEVAGGFMIVTADSLEQAIEVARECPGVVMPGSSVEVREIHTS
jgi:hypothetical protein